MQPATAGVCHQWNQSDQKIYADLYSKYQLPPGADWLREIVDRVVSEFEHKGIKLREDAK